MKTFCEFIILIGRVITNREEANLVKLISDEELYDYFTFDFESIGPWGEGVLIDNMELIRKSPDEKILYHCRHINSEKQFTDFCGDRKLGKLAGDEGDVVTVIFSGEDSEVGPLSFLKWTEKYEKDLIDSAVIFKALGLRGEDIFPADYSMRMVK